MELTVLILQTITMLLTLGVLAWYTGLFFGPEKYRPPGCESWGMYKYANVIFTVCKIIAFWCVFFAILLTGVLFVVLQSKPQ